MLLSISSFSFSQWTIQTSGVLTTLRSVYFVNDSMGWVCGEASLGLAPILKTTDGGNVWTVQYHPTAFAFRGIHFIDADTGIIAGFGGTILRTINGGNTWDSISSGTVNNLRSVYFPSHDTGYICGSAGIVLKSTDAGKTWAFQSSGITVDLINIRFPSNDTGYAVASDGSLLNGAIIQTTNGGASWTNQYSNAAVGLLGLAVVNSKVAYAGGENQTIVKTSNGGNTWNQVFTGIISQPIRSGDFIDSLRGWMVGGTAGNIYYTTDGGSSWIDQGIEAQEFLGIHFPSASTGYTVGTGGAILKYSNPCAFLSAIGPIAGITSICEGDSLTFTYSIDTIAGATGYVWEVPSGSTITGGNGSTSIVVSFGDTSGNVSVTASNICDTVTSMLSIMINPLPAIPVITFINDTLATDSASSYQWYLNGIAISGATDQSYNPVANGLYSVTVTSAAGCSATSEQFDVFGLGSNVIAGNALLSVYPNPLVSSSVIFIEGSSKAGMILISG